MNTQRLLCNYMHIMYDAFSCNKGNNEKKTRDYSVITCMYRMMLFLQFTNAFNTYIYRLYIS